MTSLWEVPESSALTPRPTCLTLWGVSTRQPTRVLFVCLGNICRSPLGEGVFQHLVNEAGLAEHYVVDSAGTSAYHAGDLPDSRSIAVARKHGVTLPTRSRKVEASDHTAFHLLVAMDASNARNLSSDQPADATARIVMMRAYDPDGPGDVPDPYYGGPRGFDDVYTMVERSCRRLLEQLEAERA